MPRLSEISINPVGYTPAGFTPVTYTPQIPNVQLYNDAINEHNRITENIAQNRGTIAGALNLMEVDESERDWVNNYAQSINNEIDDLIGQNKFRSAMNLSMELAKSAVTDPRLTSRSKRHAAYEAQKNEILNDNTIDEITKQRWLDQNKYNTDLNTDNNDIVNSWKAAWNPIKNIRLDDVVSKAVQHVAERSRANSGNKSNTTGNITTGSGSSHSECSKSLQEITAVYKELIDVYPLEMAWLRQDYENQQWIIDKYEQKLANGETPTNTEKWNYNTAKSKIGKAAGVMSEAEYAWKLMGNTLEYSAYRNTSDSSESINKNISTTNSGSTILDILENNRPGSVTTTTGPAVELRLNVNNVPQLNLGGKASYNVANTIQKQNKFLGNTH